LYFDEGFETENGNFISIFDDSSFRAGECYLQNGAMLQRGTYYGSDGKTETFNRKIAEPTSKVSDAPVSENDMLS